MHTDRRVAGGVVALAALVLAATIAATLGTATADAPHEDERTIARDLLVLARRGEGRTYRVDYALTRRIPGTAGLSSTVTEWVRARPPLLVEWGSGTLSVSSATGSWICTTVAAGPACLRSGDPSPAQPVIAPYALALGSGRYDIARAPDRRLVGVDAQCFVLRVVPRAEAIVGIGDELMSCFAPNGVLVASRRVEDGAIDTRTATGLRNGVSRADLVRLARRATDGSVAALPSK